jgi:hypothetical protein
MESQDCPHCGKEEACDYRGVDKINAIMNPVRKRKDDGRMIFDEREVEADKGKDWRDEGTNRRPGGAGGKLFFH